MIKQMLLKMFCFMVSVLKPLEKKVMFESFGGLQYSDNPRAISERMHEMYPDYRIIWTRKRMEDTYNVIPDYVSYVDTHTLRYYIQLWTSIAFVTNTNIGISQKKRNGQLFVQTWHADRYFKKVLFEAEPTPVDRRAICDEIVTDIALAGSKFGVESYHSAFHYHGKILNYGCPRNEKMLNMTDVEKRKVLSRLGVGENEKILLFAPTFRDNSLGKQSALIDLSELEKAVRQRFGGNWRTVVRGHLGTKIEQADAISEHIDATDYPDMTDLLAVTDFLVTDYSSSILDYYLTGKPSVLALFDIKEYKRYCRSFKVDPRDTPFICAHTQTELVNKVLNYDVGNMKERYKKVDELFGTNETGKSTQIICELIDDYYTEVVNHIG